MADVLTALSCNLQEDNHYILFDSPPDSVNQFVDDDVIGVSTPHLVPI